MNSVFDGESSNIASLLKHSEKTSKKYYNLSQSDVRAARMSNIIDKVVRGEAPTDQDLAPARSCMLLNSNIDTFTFF